MPEFHYDKSRTVGDNFLTWFDMNTVEKKAYGEEPYSVDQAKIVFETIFNKKVQLKVDL